MDIDVVWHAVQSVLTLWVIGGTGYLLARAGWFSPDVKVLLPKLATLVALPPYMLYNITSSFTRDELLHLVYGTVVPVISILLCFGLSLALGKLIKVRPKRRGLFYTGFTASN
ncbi:MAG: AEC family transporter, partial [Desulfovibrio sp.]|nr:AEC family transporter [Desulfovibrio sp.]